MVGATPAESGQKEDSAEESLCLPKKKLSRKINLLLQLLRAFLLRFEIDRTGSSGFWKNADWS